MLAYTMRLMMMLARGGIAAVMPRGPQKWYNMQHINMSGNLPMGIAENLPRVKYSAAYSTGRERIAKVTPLPYGLSTMVLLYQ